MYAADLDLFSFAETAEGVWSRLLEGGLPCAHVEAGLAELAGSPLLAGLRALDVSGNDVNDAGVRAVAGSRPRSVASDGCHTTR